MLPQVERGTVTQDPAGKPIETAQRDAAGQPTGTPLRKRLVIRTQTIQLHYKSI